MNEEIWKAVVGMEGLYEVSSLGAVRSLPRRLTRSDGLSRNWKSKMLPKSPCNSGYYQVALNNGSTVKKYLIHRLVADAFYGIPSGMVVNHRDADKTNNNASNLEVCTSQYNSMYSRRIMKAGIGERYSKKGLTEQKAWAIIAFCALGFSQRLVGSWFGIGAPSVCDICKGRIWGHISRYRNLDGVMSPIRPHRRSLALTQAASSTPEVA